MPNPILKPFVIVESPYAASPIASIEQHVRYARAAIRDCLLRGEAPFASHLLYTQDGVLRDEIPSDRQLGIEAGLAVGLWTSKTVVYDDFGMSRGMLEGIKAAEQAGRSIEYRRILSISPVNQPDGIEAALKELVR